MRVNHDVRALRRQSTNHIDVQAASALEVTCGIESQGPLHVLLLVAIPRCTALIVRQIRLLYLGGAAGLGYERVARILVRWGSGLRIDDAVRSDDVYAGRWSHGIGDNKPEAVDIADRSKGRIVGKHAEISAQPSPNPVLPGRGHAYSVQCQRQAGRLPVARSCTEQQREHARPGPHPGSSMPCESRPRVVSQPVARGRAQTTPPDDLRVCGARARDFLTADPTPRSSSPSSSLSLSQSERWHRSLLGGGCCCEGAAGECASDLREA
jgi:hypothetical protein